MKSPRESEDRNQYVDIGKRSHQERLRRLDEVGSGAKKTEYFERRD